VKTLTHFHINVDVQKDFCPGGKLGIDKGNEVIDPLNRISSFAREIGGLVFHTGDQHPLVTSHFLEFGGRFVEHCVVGTDGAKFHPRLIVCENDIIISKGTHPGEDAFSGFDGFDRDGRSIADHIRQSARGEVYLTIGGLATEYCDKATAFSAINLSAEIPMKVIVLTDAMRAVNAKPDDGDNALDDMNNYGAILMTTDNAIQLIHERAVALAA
jgi:nicotinamidase/pyrazinamidase